MKKRLLMLVLVAMIMMAFAAPASAFTNYVTSAGVGSNYWTSGINVSGDTYPNSNLGLNSVNYNYSGLSSVNTNIGNYHYFYLSNGDMITQYKIGNYDYYYDNKTGVLITGCWIGNTYYCW